MLALGFGWSLSQGVEPQLRGGILERRSHMGSQSPYLIIDITFKGYASREGRVVSKCPVSLIQE